MAKKRSSGRKSKMVENCPFERTEIFGLAFEWHRLRREDDVHTLTSVKRIQLRHYLTYVPPRYRRRQTAWRRCLR